MTGLAPAPPVVVGLFQDICLSAKIMEKVGAMRKEYGGKVQSRGVLNFAAVLLSYCENLKPSNQE